MNAVKLYEKYTQAELVNMAAALERDPVNLTAPGTSIYRFTPAARRKLDAINRAITWHLADTRKRQGNPVVTSGYSGRQSNRR